MMCEGQGGTSRNWIDRVGNTIVGFHSVIHVFLNAVILSLQLGPGFSSLVRFGALIFLAIIVYFVFVIWLELSGSVGR